MHLSNGVERAVACLFVAALMTLSLASGAGADSLTPTPSQAPNDKEQLWTDGCMGWERTVKPPDCVFGDPNGTFTVALVGDSHTSDLFPAFSKIATARHWRLYTFVKIDCPFLDIAINSADHQRPYPECATWNAAVLKRLQKLKPDLTFTAPFRWIYPQDASQATPAAEGAAIGRMLAQVPGRSVVMVDTPFSSRDVPTCVMSHSVAGCAIPMTQVMEGGVKVREREAAQVGHATFLNLTSKICGGFPCRVVTNGILMFRDSHHLTATYAGSLAPVLDAALQRILT